MPNKTDITIYLPGADTSLSSAPLKRSLIKSKVINLTERRRRKKKGGYINFYDLGEYLVDGNWIDDSRLIKPTASDLTSLGLGFADWTNPNTVLAKINQPLQIPISEWKDTFHKIEYDEAEYYRLRVGLERVDYDFINTRNPNWQKDKGLLIATDSDIRQVEELIGENVTTNNFYSIFGAPQKDNIAVFYDQQSGVGFYDNIFQYMFLSTNDERFKITKVPDFNASAIELNGVDVSSGNVSVYLNRTMISFYIQRRADGEDYAKYLNVFFSAYPKSIFTNESFGFRVERPFNDTEFKNDFIKAQLHFPGARQLHYDDSSASFTEESYFEDWQASDYNYNITANYYRPSGAFLGAVNSNGDWYFVWQV